LSLSPRIVEPQNLEVQKASPSEEADQQIRTKSVRLILLDCAIIAVMAGMLTVAALKIVSPAWFMVSAVAIFATAVVLLRKLGTKKLPD
jgi:uncharacterized membrane protein